MDWAYTPLGGATVSLLMKEWEPLRPQALHLELPEPRLELRRARPEPLREHLGLRRASSLPSLLQRHHPFSQWFLFADL